MLEKYKNPITKQENIVELHHILVQTVIDYAKKNNLTDIDEVQFTVDGLSGEYGSVASGEWVPTTDSSLEIIGIQEEEDRFYVRKYIGSSF